MRSRRVRLLGWSVILASPLLFFCGAEALVRLLGLSPDARQQATVPAWLDRNILVKESRWIEQLQSSPRDFSNYYRTYRFDRYLLYALRPGLDLPLTDITAPASIRDRTRWIFHTNSRGFNAREIPYSKPPGVFRIVALGDSSTFGWGVDSEKSYPHVLERLLNSRHPGRRIEVVNLGVCGYCSLQGLTLMQSEALRYGPDVVTLSYGSNDYSQVPEPFDAILERNKRWSGFVREALSHSQAYQWYSSLVLSAVPGTHSTQMQTSPPAPGVPIVLNVGPDKSEQNLLAMANLASAHGIDAIFVTNCVPGDMASPIFGAASRARVPVLDTGALLEGSVKEVMQGGRFGGQMSYYRGLYGEDLLKDYPWLSVYLTDQCHPNIIGQQLIAEYLVPLVEATGAFGRFSAAAP